MPFYWEGTSIQRYSIAMEDDLIRAILAAKCPAIFGSEKPGDRTATGIMAMLYDKRGFNANTK